jgi:hypothetical protein
MGSIDVGGDSSVTWKVDAVNVRRLPANPAIGVPPQSNPQGPGGKGHLQQGIDEAGAGNFTITLKPPPTVISSSATEVKYNLPIQYSTPDQIKVEWISTPPSIATTISGETSAKKTGRAKKSVKKQARKKAKRR